MEPEPTDPATVKAVPAPGRKGRWWKRLLMIGFAAGVIFFFGVVPYTLGGLATRRRFSLPDKENAEYVKTSFTLAHEEIQLITSDGVSLAGWWVPAANPRGTVILVHGLNRTRIEMVQRVAPLNSWGFNCLLIDLRHHGASGGDGTTFGLKEKLDVRAATDFALSKTPGPVVLWGVSMGGATVTLAAADDPRVKGLITDSSYDSVPNTIRHHLRLFRSFRLYGIPALQLVPQWPTSSLVLFWIKQRGGFDPEEVDVVKAVDRLKDRATLFVANRGDVRIPFAIAEEMQKRAGAKSSLLLTASKTHGGAWREARQPYEAAVKRLLDSVAPPLEGAPASKVEAPAQAAVKVPPERNRK